MNLLFVCSGNTCRSPLAVAAWQAFAVPFWAASALPLPPDLHTIQVGSAGLTATEGTPASHYTRAIARTWEVDLNQHRARRLSASLVAEAHLILAMTTDQAATIRLRFDVDEHQVHLLGDFVPFVEDTLARLTGRAEEMTSDANRLANRLNAHPSILDPYGGSLEAYQTCAEQIRVSVLGLAHALRSGELENLGEKRDA